MAGKGMVVGAMVGVELLVLGVMEEEELSLGGAMGEAELRLEAGFKVEVELEVTCHRNFLLSRL